MFTMQFAKSPKAYSVKACLIIGIPLSMCYMLTFYLLGWMYELAGCITLTASLILAGYLYHKSWLDLSAKIIAYTVTLVIMWGNYVSGGINSPNVIFLVPAMFISSILVDKYDFKIITGMIVMHVLSLLFIPSDYFPNELEGSIHKNHYLAFAMITSCLVVAFFILKFNKHMGQAVAKIHNKNIALTGLKKDLAEKNESLIRALNSEKKSNQAKHIFLTQMSHEFRTPLNIIIGHSELLGLQDISKDAKESVKDIHDAGLKLFALVDSLLKFVDLKTRNEKDENHPIVLSELIETILQHYHKDIERKELSIKVHGDSKLTIVNNKALISECIAQLIDNAVNYNHQRGHIDVRFDIIGQHGVNISIKDTGVGLNESEVEDAFIPCWRDSQAQSMKSGLGIGLFIVKLIAENIGGSITLESNKADGTLALFNFPRC